MFIRCNNTQYPTSSSESLCQGLKKNNSIDTHKYDIHMMSTPGVTVPTSSMWTTPTFCQCFACLRRVRRCWLADRVGHMMVCALCRKPTSGTWRRTPQLGWPWKMRTRTWIMIAMGTPLHLLPKRSSCPYPPSTTQRYYMFYFICIIVYFRRNGPYTKTLHTSKRHDIYVYKGVRLLSG